jgi:predicted nucleic acid-binding protein
MPPYGWTGIARAMNLPASGGVGPAYNRPYLDACVWIDILDPASEDERATVAAILAAADRGEIQIVASALMELELTGRGDEAKADLQLAALSRSSVITVGADGPVVRLARKLRMKHRLKSMDALHVASAVIGRADVFLTRDHKVGKLPSDAGVRITQTYWPGDVELPILGDN